MGLLFAFVVGAGVGLIVGRNWEEAREWGKKIRERFTPLL